MTTGRGLQEQATGRGDVLTGDPLCVGPGEEGDHGGDVVGLAEALERGSSPPSDPGPPVGWSLRSMSVSVAPDETVLPVIPRAPSSRAATAVACSRAALLAL
jgi:hypothetical protein